VKIVTVVGTRPQFIKAVPVSRVLTDAGIDERMIDTGQHYDANMSAVFFEELGLRRPAYELGIGSGPHGDMTGRMLKGIEKVLVDERPDRVLVYGDTNTTLAGALAAAKLDIPIVHIEAGLRSYRRGMPEEINRRVTDHLSSVLFCPSDVAVENLRREGIVDGGDPNFPRQVMNVGDVMVDALRSCRDASANHPWQTKYGRGGYVLATIHRAESTDDGGVLSHLASQMRALAARIPVLLPLHPRTRAALEEIDGLRALGTAPGVHCTEPLSYREFTAALAGARAVVTDSGGVQKEAMILGTPCITLREETEWVETVKLGWNRLAGSRPRDLAELVLAATPPCERAPDVYGDGRAATRIAAALAA
jgi:UDP-GlcNAc3NAcA epimerase